ncbi:phage BR0599 family protein, partial [Azospirillum sp. B4]|uniref:phage BR0599 family protein n=1 Tax=Azospirillum sp. B4 TaxID=95605 RepID=UPI0005C9DA8F
YQANCLHTLYDSGCALARSRYTRADTVANGSTVQRLVPATPLASLAAITADDGSSKAVDPAAFVQGALTFTGGRNAGVTRAIKAADADGLTLAYALPHQPTVGDPFRITYGCDHTAATCQARFGNLANIRAFPYIPAAETAA